ncbi:MAG: PAS domain-containing hybrid sensor histidine kinase/response regulator [Ancalomicrobiaceae bacterium]|nr:PAS domain-containing hybrid sensor histidine kinase/response regulator [Ancalomicrobiaceae bacterium]
MHQGWVVITVALAYILALFAIAYYGDKAKPRIARGASRPLVYSMTLGVYCTSWTFFGSVGLAAHRGFDFLTIYIGPILMFVVFFPVLKRIIRLAKAERITSVADFMAARYGKSEVVAAVVTIIAFIGIVPYIALQLKAVSTEVSTLVAQSNSVGRRLLEPNIAAAVALAMALFACLFGTRHVDATEHQRGLMLAVAAESVVKLLSFSIVGIFVVYTAFGGFSGLIPALATTSAQQMFSSPPSGGSWIVMSLLSFFAIILLPRMFHVTVVENNNEDELKAARWLFPSYLVAINLFVVPIALGGLIRFGDSVDADTFVLRLPHDAGQGLVTLMAFVGGLSAASAMVIVASISLSLMVCNELVVPLILRGRYPDVPEPENIGKTLLWIRRIAVFVILTLAYLYYLAAVDGVALADIGLVAFAAMAQLAPAFFGGLIWRDATARGAIAGMSVGFLIWLYTLLIPSFVDAGYLPQSLVDDGPFGLWLLKPRALFGFSFDPLVHGVFWSLAANVATFVAASLSARPEAIERLQANIFVPSELATAAPLRLWRTAVTLADLRSTVSRYLGEERTERAFDDFYRSHRLVRSNDTPADPRLLRLSEQLLASAIGAASSRLVLSLLVKRRDPASKVARKLLDDASSAIQYNRDLLQTALDQVAQGIAVFDRELRLICWNRQFHQVMALAPEQAQAGTTLSTILRASAERGELGPGNPERIVKDRIDRLILMPVPFQERFASSGRVVEVRSSPMPDGGIVATWTDITERVEAAEQLARANETLEKPVRERTEELTRLNEALTIAKQGADEANISKTKFLAHAGHDIAQPLNAARLYAASLLEQSVDSQFSELAGNIDLSLDAVEEIIGALIDISRLDAGALKPEFTVFAIEDILRPLRIEFEPIAHEKGVTLKVVPSALSVRSDKRLLRRLVQNLVSNAIKYTPGDRLRPGKVLVGCRRRRGRLAIEVLDTGLGIPLASQQMIFQEFERLPAGARVARGLGLGLSIVERISRVLGSAVKVQSEPGRGSCFSFDQPIAVVLPGQTPDTPPHAVALDRFEGMLVVCIDNDQSILAGMEKLIGGWGCAVISARDHREALAALKERGKAPDALIVDYHLDEGTGIEAVVQLRWRFGADLPAMLITADRSPEVREEARDKGLIVLNKPIRPAALRSALAQIRHSTAAE